MKKKSIMLFCIIVMWLMLLNVMLPWASRQSDWMLEIGAAFIVVTVVLMTIDFIQYMVPEGLFSVEKTSKE